MESFPQCTICGEVKDINNNTALIGANIIIEGTNLGTCSNNTGNYVIEDVPKGEYFVKASFSGYGSKTVTIIISDTISVINFYLEEFFIDLNEVVITATRTEKTLKNVPVLTQVISEKQIEHADAVTAMDALDMTTPGVDFNKDTHGSGMKLNGLDNKSVLILIDGERMAGSTKGNVNFSRLNTDNIKKIEIVKGAYSTLYGSNAIGGVINIITNDAESPLEVGVKSRISDYNELNLNSYFSFKLNKFNSWTDINRKNMGEYDLDPEDPEIITQKRFTDYSFTQKFNYIPFEKLSFQLNGAYYQHERFNPVNENYTILDASHPFDLNYGFSLKSRYKINITNYVETSLHFDQYDIFTIKDNQISSKELNNRDVFICAKIMGGFTLKRHILSIGSEYNKEKLVSSRTISNKGFDDYVLFTQDEFPVTNKLTSVIGYRLNHHTEYGVHFTPKISLMYNLSGFIIRGNYGMGYRSPSLKEKYFNFDHGGLFYIKGDEGLKPEGSEYKSVSFEYIKPKVNASVTFFRNDMVNMIDYKWMDNSDTVYVTNINKALNQGVDLLIKARITSNFSVNTSYSFLDAKNKETGLELENVAGNMGKMSLDYQYKINKYELNVNLQAKVVGEKHVTVYEVVDRQDVAVYKTTPMFSIFKITSIHNFSYSKSYILSVGMGIDNIFNFIDRETYPFTTTSPGRRIFASIKIMFKK